VTDGWESSMHFHCSTPPWNRGQPPWMPALHVMDSCSPPTWIPTKYYTPLPDRSVRLPNPRSIIASTDIILTRLCHVPTCHSSLHPSHVLQISRRWCGLRRRALAAADGKEGAELLATGGHGRRHWRCSTLPPNASSGRDRRELSQVFLPPLV
jgi:hypothetical protein